MPASCSNCRHHVGPEVGGDRRRECHAASPTLGRECHDPAHGKHPVFLAMWPLTMPADGCGDWSAPPGAGRWSAPAPKAEPKAEPEKKAPKKGG
jgi:hypothetical protein